MGYLFLLQRLLEHLRYRADRGYADASQLIADFQADVVAQVEAGNVDGGMPAFVGGALHQSKTRRRQSLPRRRQTSSLMGARTDRFRPTSTPFSPDKEAKEIAHILGVSPGQT
jgi:hypothetical protein